jgi:hypothetical protein
MRRYFLVFVATLCLSIVFLCACEKNKEYSDLNLETENLSVTMKNYFNDESPNYKGTVFQIKPKSIFAVPFSVNYLNRTYYRYRLIIAPITTEPIEIESIRVQPSNKKIRDYLSNSNTLVGLGNLDEWNSVTKDMVYFIFTETEEFTAYQLEITFNNLGDSTLSESGITVNEFEDGIRNIEVVIKYNGKEDIIRLDEIDLQLIESENDEVLSTRDDLTELLEIGSTYSGMEPYR